MFKNIIYLKNNKLLRNDIKNFFLKKHKNYNSSFICKFIFLLIYYIIIIINIFKLYYCYYILI